MKAPAPAVQRWVNARRLRHSRNSTPFDSARFAVLRRLTVAKTFSVRGLNSSWPDIAGEMERFERTALESAFPAL